MQAPNSPYGALPADAQEQGMGEQEDNAEPAPLGGAAASLAASLSSRFEVAPTFSPEYHAAIDAARRSITSGARDAGIL